MEEVAFVEGRGFEVEREVRWEGTSGEGGGCDAVAVEGVAFVGDAVRRRRLADGEEGGEWCGDRECELGEDLSKNGTLLF